MKNPKVGDRVAVYLSDRRAAEYFGGYRLTGKIVLPLPNGILRVELDNTGSQDSEGNNATTDVHPLACRRLKAKARRRVWLERKAVERSDAVKKAPLKGGWTYNDSAVRSAPGEPPEGWIEFIEVRKGKVRG